MTYAIKVSDLNSQAIEATLDDELFYIILNWNQSRGHWTLSLRNAGYETIISSISISPNYSLIRQFRYSDLPPGELIVETMDFESGPIPRDGFVSGKYSLNYYTEQDIRLINAI